jgi:hypothetical protein
MIQAPGVTKFMTDNHVKLRYLNQGTLAEGEGTVGLLVLTSLDKLPLIVETLRTFLQYMLPY